MVTQQDAIQLLINLAEQNPAATTYSVSTSADQHAQYEHGASEFLGIIYDEWDRRIDAPLAGGWGYLDPSQKGAVSRAFELIADVANITFTQVAPGSGNIRFSTYSGAVDTLAFQRDETNIWHNGSFMPLRWNAERDGVFLNRAAAQDFRLGGDGAGTMIHEILHAIGLNHPGAYNGDNYTGPVHDYDNQKYSIMSYNRRYGEADTPMLNDIAALQALYGANTNTRTGDTRYGFNASADVRPELKFNLNSSPMVTVWDGGGNDTLDLSDFRDPQKIDLRPGRFSSVGGRIDNLAVYANGPQNWIENAVGGSGSDTLIGNAADNFLDGRGGFDTVEFQGNLRNFYFSETTHYQVTGVIRGSVTGTDALVDIERFVFDDATVMDDNVGGVLSDATLSPGSSFAGSTQFFGDRDWFSPILTFGHDYLISLRGASSGGGTLVNTLLRVHDLQGNVVRTDDDGGSGLDSQLAVRFTNGIGFLKVDVGSSGPDIGTYTIDIQDLGVASARNFLAPRPDLAAFGPGAGGWSSDDRFPRELADVNGDRRADIVGFGEAGVYVSLATEDGNFGPVQFKLPAFGASDSRGGWSSDDRFPRELADVNGDRMADIVGFGNAGVYVSLATGGGEFGPMTFRLAAFGASDSRGGWSSDDRFPRELADVNADGMADILGFGNAGVYLSLATGDGNFGPTTFALNAFGASPGGGSWTSDDRYPRLLADVTGEGLPDIVGFGDGGVYVALGTGAGKFGPMQFKLSAFGAGAGAWSSDDRYPRELADVNGDRRADIIGFGEAGVYVAYATGDGSFGPATFTMDAFGASPGAGTWSSNDLYGREVADVTGDGLADIVGFGHAAVYVAPSLDFFIV